MEPEKEFPETTPIEFILQLYKALSTFLSKYPPIGRASQLFESLYPGGFKFFSIGKGPILTDQKNYIVDFPYPKHFPFESLPMSTPDEIATSRRILILIDEILRIFFRLTQKPSGSLVPLLDLLDPMESFKNTDHQVSAHEKFMFYRFLLQEVTTKIKFPIKYYPSSAVFEREEDTLQRVTAIENVRAVLQGICPHCYGNFTKTQVEAFTNHEIVTCQYCDHSIKGEWQSDV